MDPERARELLSSHRQRIERELADLLSADDTELSDLDQHLGDDAEELYEAELDQGLAEELEQTLQAIVDAEQRVADGTYGLSIESGEPIPDERLEAIPWAERTAEEQRRYDRGI